MDKLPDIQTSISSPDLFLAFKNQMKKDFDFCALPSGFIDDFTADYDFIMIKTEDAINKITNAASSKLSELLYRIDISEQQIKKLTQQKSESSFNAIIAELIIKRELQKVVIKEFYRKND